MLACAAPLIVQTSVSREAHSGSACSIAANAVTRVSPATNRITTPDPTTNQPYPESARHFSRRSVDLMPSCKRGYGMFASAEKERP